MKSNLYFKTALIYKLKEEGLRQKDVTDSLNIQSTQLSGYLKDKRGFSEERKELISEFFGMSFFEMLELGKSLCEGTVHEKKEPDDSDLLNNKNDPEYLNNLVSKMQWMIEKLSEDVERKVEDIKELKEDIEEYKVEIQDYIKENKEIKEDYKRVQKELEELKSQAENLKKEAS